jgi:formamidopyrimidine-DNA glycosylase
MPELPEVETVITGIKKFEQELICDIIVRNYSLRYKVDKNISDLCIGKQVIKIFRRAKYIILVLSNCHLIIHLGMSGTITLLDNNNQKELKKHDHFDIISNNYIIRYNDPRRFGSLILCNDYQEHCLIKNLGPEPLSIDFNTEYLFNKLKNRKITIKQSIMDNKIVVGVGNIYASESLFIANINPLRLSNSITKVECENLVNGIKMILSAAIELGGSTLRDYKQADGSLGYFQNNHKVYGKSDEFCYNCKTVIIKSIRVGQRNTFYCPNCQK